MACSHSYLSFLSLERSPCTLSMSLVHPYCPHLLSIPLKKPNLCEWHIDYKSEVKLWSFMLWKRKRFQALPHSLSSATFYPCSVFFFPPFWVYFSVPCLFVDIKAILMLLKMTAVSSVSYFHVIYNRNGTPPPKEKNRVRRGRRKNWVCRPQGLSNRMMGLGLKKILFCSFSFRNNREREGKAVIRKFTELLSN